VQRVTLREAALASGSIDAKQFDAVVVPAQTVGRGAGGA
jgi:fumarate hydratase class II